MKLCVYIFMLLCSITPVFAVSGYGYSEGGSVVTTPPPPGAADAKARISALLPKADSGGWTLSDKPAFYTPANLFEYINGNADLFKSYGFMWLVSGKYIHAGLPNAFITVDVYDMAQPINAFGIYSTERAGDIQHLKLGTQGYHRPDLLVFWQDRYLVKISAVGAGKDAATVMLALAHETAKAIPDPATLPKMLKLLPAQGRIVNTEKYTRQNFLGHAFLANAISAEYQVGKGRITGFVVEAANPQAANTQVAKLKAFEKAEAKGLATAKIAGATGFSVRDPYLGAMVVVASGNRIIGAYGGADTKAAVVIVSKLMVSCSASIRKGDTQ